jgi:SAM-dependent methyltransferase
VGCGFGYLLAAARGYFDHRAGTELSARAAEEARRWADIVYRGALGDIPRSEGFDLVIASHVIEQVYDPYKFIETLLSHLKPGGKLLLATPDMGSFWHRVMGRRWPSFKIPEHVLYFSRDSLHGLNESMGLLVQRIPFPHAFPLTLGAEKCGVHGPASLGAINVWLPTTTIALCGARPDE